MIKILFVLNYDHEGPLPQSHVCSESRDLMVAAGKRLFYSNISNGKSYHKNILEVA